MKSRRLLALFLALAAGAALAEQPPLSAEERKALRSFCEADVKRLCAGVEPGGGRLKDCLMQHKEEMSVGCAEALQKLKDAKKS